MAAPTLTSYSCPSGGEINAGRSGIVSLQFTDGTAGEQSLAAAFPDTDGAAGIRLLSGSLPAGVTLDPVGKRLVYDGTLGVTGASVSLQSKPDAPSLRIVGGSGNVPIMAGAIFPEGLVVGPLGTNTTGVHVQVQRTWNDGTVKHAIACGVCPATSQITFNTAPAGGTNLTSADIATAAPSASIDLGSGGSVTLASLLATPFETWVSTPGMVECHYRATLSTNAEGVLYAEFQVRLWSNGECWVRANIESSLQQRASSYSNAPLVINGTVTIDGTVVQTYTAKNLYVGCILIHERWVGATQHAHTVRNNIKQLPRTKLLKYYAFPATVPEGALALNNYTYTPDSIGRFSTNMPQSGYQHQLGPLPLWEAEYLRSDDDRAYQAVVEHAKAAFSFPILWRVPSGARAGRLITPTDYPTLNGLTGGAAAAGFGQQHAIHHWEQAHQPSMGYTAYLLTGDATACDAMLANCSSLFQAADRRFGLLDVGLAANNNGVNRVDFNLQVRAQAWTTRTLAQAAAVAPDSADEWPVFRQWYENITRYWMARSVNDPAATDSETGLPFCWSTMDPALPQAQGLWHYDWWSDSVGWSIDLGAVSASFLPDLQTFSAWMYRGIVGRLGHPAGEFCFSQAGLYWAQVSDEVVPNYSTRWASSLYQSMAQLYTATKARLNLPDCSNTLYGSGYDIRYATRSFFGNLLPAISSAVDHGIPGAAAGWARLTGADNWNTFLLGFEQNLSPEGYSSVWGISPRPALTTKTRTAAISFAEAPPEYPAWRPAENTIANISLNTLYDARNEGGSSDVKTKGQLDDWSGAIFAATFGTYGSVCFQGGGHSDSRETSVYRYDIETRLFSKDRVKAANVYLKSDNLCADPTTGWLWANAIEGDTSVQVGEPFAQHTYNRIVWTPPGSIAGSAPNGWFYTAGRGSMPDTGQSGTWAHHAMPLGISLTQPWQIVGTGYNAAPHGWALYDSLRNRVVSAQGDAPYTMRVLYAMDLAAGTPSQLTWLSADGPGVTPYYAFGHYDEAEDLYYNIRWNSATGLIFQIYDPAANKAYTAVVSGTAPTAGEAPGDMAIEWVEAYRSMVLMNYNTNKIWCLKAPTNPRTGTWAWSSRTLGGVTMAKPLIEQNPAYSKFQYVPDLDILVWFAYHTLPAQGIVITPP